MYPRKTIHEKLRRIIYRRFHFITCENGHLLRSEIRKGKKIKCGL